MCCGGNRAAGRASLSAGAMPGGVRSTSMAGPVVVFEYVGVGAATYRGPVTGQLYRFNRSGDRVRVDVRDRAGLAALSVLRGVR